MFENWNDFKLTPARARGPGRRLCFYLITSGTVTVLLFAGALGGTMRCEGTNATGPCLFEFTAEFFAPVGRIYLEGLMAYDGSRHRIAVYWFEPAILNDHDDSDTT